MGEAMPVQGRADDDDDDDDDDNSSISDKDSQSSTDHANKDVVKVLFFSKWRHDEGDGVDT
jgi:hypothetical protein